MFLDPNKMGLKVQRISKIRNAGVAIELKDSISLEKIKAEPKLKAVVEATMPKKRRPKVLIYDVPRGFTEKALVENIHGQNGAEMSLEQFSGKCKHLFRTGPRNAEITACVVEVSARVRNDLMKSNRVCVGCTSCKVVDHYIITRYFKCQKYGHIAKLCQSKAEVRGHCAVEGHGFKACPSNNDAKKAKCVNCTGTVRGGKPVQANHPSSDRKCTLYVSEREKMIIQTDYGQ